ncbi:MAG: DUF3300 domain-containing protein [Candidatus Sulfotelmatobacter sp.]
MNVMNVDPFRTKGIMQSFRQFFAIVCAIALLSGDQTAFAREASQEASTEEQAAKIPSEQLDSLVAPIALYPDPLLSQTLVASTYPLEIIQLQQWIEKNKNLKDQALADAVKKQDWDPSIQAMAALPDVVKQMADNIKWTTDLGNAFLAQQGDVMEAVQRMRKKAKDGGNLKSSDQQKIETKVVESKQVIVIEQANPEVVYVPSYNPTVVYGALAYPYPPIAYPPPGYYAAGMAISFGVGIAMGAAWGGGWGYNSGWGGGNNNININNNNNFVRNSNRQNVSNRTANGTWQHNPQHRGGAPYSNGATARKYGGTSRGDSMTTRQAKARQNQGQRGGLQQAGDRGSVGNRAQPGASDRSARGGNSGNRGGSGGAANTGANRGGGDRVGNRSTSSGGGSRNSGAFGGASGGSSGKSARASSSRGSSSMGGGGGRSGGGGGRRR